MSTRIARRLVIRGIVQGVGYRWSLVEQARRLGVTGWVRNRLDGSVEALVCGEAVAVDAVVTWAHNGPRGARVMRVDVTVVEPFAADGFEQIPSA